MGETLFNYEQARNGNQNNGEQPGYTVADHEQEVHEARGNASQQTISPGLLDRFDQERNSEWWRGYRQGGSQQDTMPPEPSLEEPSFDPVDILGAGAKAGTIGKRLWNMGKKAGQGLLKEWYDEKEKERQKQE